LESPLLKERMVDWLCDRVANGDAGRCEVVYGAMAQKVERVSYEM